VRPFLLYSLRHTFATRIASRVDAWTLCKIMGWASLSVAMTYVHASEEQVLAVFSGHVFGHVPNGMLATDSETSSQAVDAAEGYMVSAAGFEPATHALKEYPTRPAISFRSVQEQRETMASIEHEGLACISRSILLSSAIS
jgi:hypothetical protein